MAAAVLGALLTTAASLALGRVLTRRLDVPVSVAFGAGAALLHLSILALMNAGLARTPPLFVLCAVSGLLPRFRPPIRLQPVPWWVAALIGVFGTVYVVNALAPEIQADANTYHLLPAIEAARSGGLPPGITFYDRLPHATELLFVPAYAVGGVPAAKLLHLGFLFWTLPLIIAIGRKLNMPAPLPAVAAAMYFVTPVAGVSASSAFNDASLVFYVLAAVWVMLELRDRYSRMLALLLGILAGMCYAVKMNGGIAIAAAGLFLLAAHRRNALLPFSAGVAIIISPWLLRNWIDVGNPLAPFFNAVFQNEYFYVASERELATDLRSYGVGFLQRFPEVTTGFRLQGTIGPLFLLAPVTLLGIRRRSLRGLWLLAIVFSAGWWLNAGARFLLPALPFLALAIIQAFPRPVAYTIFLAHALLSWPWMVPAYAPRVWRIMEFPWRTAIGLESDEAYLLRVSGDYRLARFVAENTPPDARIFDLVGLHNALIDRRLVGPWQTAEGYRLRQALQLARSSGDSAAEWSAEWSASFAPQLVAAVRIRQQSSAVHNWSLNELRLIHAAARLPNSPEWRLSSSRNPWDAPLAFDRNAASRWSTWQPGDSRDFYRVDFSHFETLDTVAFTAPASEPDSRPLIEIRGPTGDWTSIEPVRRSAPQALLRLQATRYLMRSGITHIVAQTGSEGIGVLAASLKDPADGWGLDAIASVDTTYVLRVRQMP
jgi:hypothetical protein